MTINSLSYLWPKLRNQMTKNANFILSKSFFEVKNQLNVSKFQFEILKAMKFHWFGNSSLCQLPISAQNIYLGWVKFSLGVHCSWFVVFLVGWIFKLSLKLRITCSIPNRKPHNRSCFTPQAIFCASAKLKGQFISKCLWCHRFDQKNNENVVRISALKVFKASLGLPRSFLGLPVGFLINDITY